MVLQQETYVLLVDLALVKKPRINSKKALVL